MRAFSTLRVMEITKQDCAPLLSEYHYLAKESKGFKSGVNIGLVSLAGEVLGCAIFTGFPVPELVQGMFGLPREDQDGFFELSRLVLHPEMQEEKGAASWFLSRAVKALRKKLRVRALLSYADADHHRGTVYRATNWGYYGLSEEKKDFWEEIGGSFVKVSRGPVKGKKGEWRVRSRKHRFVIVYDKALTLKWEKCDV